MKMKNAMKIFFVKMLFLASFGIMLLWALACLWKVFYILFTMSNAWWQYVLVVGGAMIMLPPATEITLGEIKEVLLAKENKED